MIDAVNGFSERISSLEMYRLGIAAAFRPAIARAINTRALELYMFSNLRARRYPRTLGAALLAGGLALGAAACAPATTDLFYAASDGTRVQLEAGTLEVVNLMVIASESGDAQLVGAVVNKTNADQVASLVSEDGTVNISVDLAPHKTFNFFTEEGTDGELSNFTAQPGSTLPVQFTDAAGNTIALHVPVMDGSLPEYSQYAK